MKVSDRNEVVIEGVVRRNRSISGDAAADLDIQIQSRRRRSRRRKGTWQHNRFDVRMSGSKAKAPRVRKGCIVRVSGQLRSTDDPDSKTYIEAKDIDVLRQPASKRGGRRKKSKAKGDGPSLTAAIPEALLQDPGDEKSSLPGSVPAAPEAAGDGDTPDEAAADTARPVGEERAAAAGPGTALVPRASD